MDLTKIIIQITLTLVILLILLIIYPLFYRIISKKIHGRIKKQEKILIKRLSSFSLWIIGIISIFIVWNFNLDSLWTTITGFLALIAIGLFAVWSILSNLIAGIMLYLTKPFRINDKIKIIPEEIQGEVLAINALFTTLKDENENLISIPNNLFFQKYVVRFV